MANPSPQALSHSDIDQFNAQGFTPPVQLFSPAEADGIRACLQRGKPHCWEPVCARATGEAAIRINHYGHAPLSEQNHTYIGAGEKLVDDHWAALLAQSLSENR